MEPTALLSGVGPDRSSAAQGRPDACACSGAQTGSPAIRRGRRRSASASRRPMSRRLSHEREATGMLRATTRGATVGNTMVEARPQEIINAIHALADAEGTALAMRHVCGSCVDLLSVDGAALFLASPDVPAEPALATNSASGELAETQTTLGEGPAVECLNAQRVVAAHDLSTPASLARWPMFAPAATAVGVHAATAFPLAGPGNGSGRGVAGAPSSTRPADVGATARWPRGRRTRPRAVVAVRHRRSRARPPRRTARGRPASSVASGEPGDRDDQCPTALRCGRGVPAAARHRLRAGPPVVRRGRRRPRRAAAL